MEHITIRPQRLRQFGATEGVHFHLVTSEALATGFKIEDEGTYASAATSVIRSMSEFEAALTSGRIPSHSHVLVIAPDVFFQSPPPDTLGPDRKLMAMACNSTPTSTGTIAHFLEVMEQTDPQDQRDRTETFFALGEASEYFRFIDPMHETDAVFNHLHEDYLWNEQTGFIDWGEQQIAPAGEISVLPLDIQKFDPSLRLDLTGTLAFKGQAVLHNGTPSYLREDQARIYKSLDAMWDHALIAHVEKGQVMRLVETHADAIPARHMLEVMFEMDSRYSVIWEIGFAVNTSLAILRGNHAMNEVHGAQNGSMHWGLGLTPYTQYHLDLITPGTHICNEKGEVVFGRRERSARMRRTNELGCGCVA